MAVTELRVTPDRRTLKVSFDDGRQYALPAELLRVRSPSAEVRGHGPADRKLVSGKRNVRIEQVLPTGNYAVRIAFDDGHDTGIYQWSYLADLGENAESRMSEYEAELKEAGKSREG